jgi:hypothetical protein
MDRRRQIGAKASNAAQGKGKQDANDKLSFASDTASKTGATVKTVQRDAKRGADIGADGVQIIK